MANAVQQATTRLAFAFVLFSASSAHAELVGYWSGNSTGGTGTSLPNDQGNADLDGELFGAAVYSSDALGITGAAGDYAITFEGFAEDYVAIPPTELTFEEITITAWVNGVQNGDWAGIMFSRADVQAIGLDFRAFDGMPSYVWNDNSSETYLFFSDLLIPEDEWTFVALTVAPEGASFYVGPLGDSLETAVNEIEHFPQDNFTEWRIGQDNCCGGGRNFLGLIDDVSIWDNALSAEELASLHNLSATPLTLGGGGGLAGDFNNDSQLDAADINLLSGKVREATNDPLFDLNADALVNDDDREIWVNELKKTWFGDADLNGEFNSTDLVSVLAGGHYEDGIEGNSQWQDGDWDGDGNFNSGDFVSAFAGGGYEAGPRPAVAAVPEPSTLLCVAAAIPLLWRRARRNHP